MASFDSKFEGFWTDCPDASDKLSRLHRDGLVSDSEFAQLTQFVSDGYVVIKNAISDELAQQLYDEIGKVSESPEYFIARTQRKSYSFADKAAVTDPSFRLIDYHANSALAQQAQFAPKIARFLELVFRQSPLAFQSLTFLHGSQQGVHQDGAYVVVSEPLKFAASWIALEDVTEGSGELLYYPGSHRLPDYLFSGKYKSWKPARDGQNEGSVYIKSLQEKIETAGLAKARFLPKKGDALIWAADLAHGGSKITNCATRYSLVTHYCPSNVAPNYESFSGNYSMQKTQSGGLISSRHYDLRSKKNIFNWGKKNRFKKPTFMGAVSE